ncbi:NAD(P)-dependent oxidoreductase [Pedobacter sp. Leaf250]|uniref:NAD-dependent epimerase/dehydratase family protein n=1 Tax=Pedobacter sp. Leaf250 TaxID=2876559 RepID=UPI001E3B4C04|nr:NAD-dependent epimerase/dehydratase family protein [Pedobacter sp. Leaf250]
MRLILTGANGFLGKVISNYFARHELIKIGRSMGDVVVNLADEIPVLPISDLVIHTAGKAHLVPATDQEKADFYRVNVTGTANLLSGLMRSGLPKYFVFISSVSVYGLEKGELINEQYPLSAVDAYGKSKIEAEALVVEWCKQHEVVCTILRLPLLAGRNPPGNLGAMVKAITNGYYFNIDKGEAQKSMVMVDDVAAFISDVHKIGGIYNLTDGFHPSFKALSLSITRQLNKRSSLSLPFLIVKALALVGDIFGEEFPVTSKKLYKMTQTLTFSDQRARNNIGWNPKSVVDNFSI